MGSLTNDTEIDPEDVYIGEDVRARARDSAIDWNHYIATYAPTNDRISALVNDISGQKRRLMGEANAEAAAGAGLNRANLAAQFGTGGQTRGMNAAGEIMDRANTFRRGHSAAYAPVNVGLSERQTRGQLSIAATGRQLQDNANLAADRLGANQTMLQLERDNRELAQKYGTRGAIYQGAGIAAGLLKK